MTIYGRTRPHEDPSRRDRLRRLDLVLDAVLARAQTDGDLHPAVQPVDYPHQPINGEAVEVGVADPGDVGLSDPGEAGGLSAAEVALSELRMILGQPS
jgi:hypothetical protein